MQEVQALVTAKPNTNLAYKESVMLQTARTLLTNPITGDSAQTQLLLDIGSSRTYMSIRLARSLRLSLKNANPVEVNRFASKTSVRIETYTTEVRIKLMDEMITIPVTVVPYIANKITRSAIDITKVINIAKKLQMADNVPLKHESQAVDFLLGNDYYSDIVTGERLMVQNGLYLIGSRLGWILSGRVPSKGHEITPIDTFFTQASGYVPTLRTIDQVKFVEPDVQKHPDMSDFWALEAIGIKELPNESDDERALRNFSDTVAVENNRYTVTLPFREGQRCTIPNNYGLCFGRLKSNIRKLREKPDLMEKISNIFTEQVKLGIIEVVENDVEVGPTIHYLPHHAVISEQRETTKVRVVYDGSSRARRDLPSLNQCLLKGPTLLENLCGILLRLRHHPIVMISDIEKAYLQVGLHVKDRDLTRFLWLKNPTLPPNEGNVIVYRFCRVPFGVNCSAFLLAQVIVHHLTTKYSSSDTAKRILEDHYVDNCITGVKDIESAKRFYTESKEMFKTASMNLTQWISNSPDVLKAIPQQDQSEKTKKVLGMGWNPKTDKFHVKSPQKVDLQNVRTKRQLLKVLGTIFDPLGLIVPAILKTKVLLQKVTQDKFDWDDRLPMPFAKEFEELATDLAKIDDFVIPRFIGPIREASHELICFTDASGLAYATTIYLRTQLPTETTCRLVFAKARLNPVKKVSIPRLELLGILIGCRALKFVAKELRLTKSGCTLFSDSQIAIAWIKADGRQETWTLNRVKAIRQMKNLKLRYVATTDNPADLATRGVAIDQIPDIWWFGPHWIIKAKKQWPAVSQEEVDVSRVEESDKTEISLIAIEEQSSPPFGIDATRISSLPKLLRITALCHGFISRCRKTKKQTAYIERMISGRQTIVVTALHIENSKELWLKHVQEQFYGKIKPKVCAAEKHEMMQLGLENNDKGLLVCHGRLGKAQISKTAQLPVLLHKNAQFTRLLIQEVHQKNGHVGMEHTLAIIRSEYWIPQVRSRISQIIRTCAICRKWHGKPYKQPNMPELPSARVNPHPAFWNTGIDFFGPLKVINRGQAEKAWVCLFTCLTVRAVHLELVTDMTSTELLSAMRRFIARRGKPSRIISDNAPQFKLAGKVADILWSRIVEDPDVVRYCSNEGIQWTFITPYAPWMGGVYERIVGIVKNPLRKILGHTLLSSSELSTLLCEIEAIVNSRPISHIGEDVDDLKVLTPNHFLMLNPTCGFSNATLEDEINEDLTAELRIVNLWKKGLHLLQEFWNQWKSEYLLNLRERSKYNHKSTRTTTETPKVGHIVIIKEDRTPRGSWKIAKIVELLCGHDGEARSATVVLPSGRKINRPVSLLCPFETAVANVDVLAPHGVSEEPNTTGKGDCPEDERKDKSKVSRRAALDARTRWQSMV